MRRLRCCYHSGVPNSQRSFARRELHTVFLDRDGVINEKMPEGQYVSAWSAFRLLPGVAKAIARLNGAGMRVVVVTNQRGVALGLYTAADVEAIHAGLERLLEADGARVDGFFYCPHDKDACSCRKPLGGLFEQAAARFTDIRAETSVMIGDSLSDIEFGRRLGMMTVFIEGDAERGDAERRKPGGEKASGMADLRFGSLAEAVEGLLG